MSAEFLIGATPDLRNAAGEPSFGRGPLATLEGMPGVRWEWLPEGIGEVSPAIAARYDALYVGGARVAAGAVAGPGVDPPRLKLVARHGVGFDNVDVPRMSAAGVMVTNTPRAVRRPVATMAMTFVLALAQRLFAKDRLTRTAGWGRRTDFMGQGLTGKVLGLVGAGGIGREIIPLARAFDMRVLVADPYVDPAAIGALGATLVPLDEALAAADFVVIACLLNEGTFHLIDASRLARMKRSAYLVNVARGPVVDEPALVAALCEGRIAGAALDVFEQEPVAPDNPLLAMEQVIVTPHALCWTDECFDAIAREGLGAVADFASRRAPGPIVDRAVLAHPRMRAWFASSPTSPPAG